MIIKSDYCGVHKIKLEPFENCVECEKEEAFYNYLIEKLSDIYFLIEDIQIHFDENESYIDFEFEKNLKELVKAHEKFSDFVRKKYNSIF